MALILRAPLLTSYSTTFNGGNEASMHEANAWLEGKDELVTNNNIQIVSGVACATAINNPSGPYDDSICILNPAKFAIPADQTCTIVVSRAGGYSPSANHEINGFLRGKKTAAGISGYEINLSLTGQYGFIMRWEGTTNTLLSSFTQLTSISHPNLADGDIIEYKIIGTTITVRHNPGAGFTTLGSVSDSTWATGTPGIDQWAESGATLTSAGVKSFSVS